MADKQQVIRLAQAIRQVESGGNYQAKGGSGEYGAYQYMPATWKSTAQQYLGDPNAEMTPRNQNLATAKKLNDLLDRGYGVEQVASIWNSGKPEWEGKTGTNKYGQKYDVPGYVRKVAGAYGGGKLALASTNQTQPQTQTPAKSFDQSINDAREHGWSDTRFLDHLLKKYPGQASVINGMREKATGAGKSDREVLNFLSQKLAGKMPTVESVPLEQQEEQTQPQERPDNVYNKQFEPTQETGLEGFGVGIGKGIIGTTRGTFSLAQKAIESTPRGKIGKNILNTLLPDEFTKRFGLDGDQTIAEKVIPKELVETPTQSQEYGKLAENIAEFLAPATMSLKFGKALGALSKGGPIAKGAWSLLGTSLAEGFLGTGQSAMQSGEIGKEEAKIGAFSMLMPPAMVGSMKVLKPIIKPLMPLATKANKAVREAIDSGIKPYFSSTATKGVRDKYYEKATQAFSVINKYRTRLTKEGIEEVRNPTNRAEMLESLSQAKNKIFSLYDNIAKEAGELEAKFNPKNALAKLNEATEDLGFSPEIRNYAKRELESVKELIGASPELVQRRLQEYNEGLAPFFAGRMDKAKARVDATVLTLLRTELDELIEGTTGKAYQSLKGEYGALKSVEKDLTRQVALEARKSKAGLPELTDIFTGADLAVGAITGNPTMLVKGAVGRGIKEFYKWFSDPNRYIKNAFKALDDVSEATTKQIEKAILKQGVSNTPSGTKGPFASIMGDKRGVIQAYGEAPVKAQPLKAEVFGGFEDLSTKVVEKLKGKETVSKQFVADLTNSGDLKQAERDIIRGVLATTPEGKINVAEFADKVKRELLPLTPETSKGGTARYESIALPDDLRGNVANYYETVYNSPIKTSAGKVHFGEELSENYFGHTRVEDIADVPAKDLAKETDKLIAEGKTLSEIKAMSEGQTGTRRVIEIQSDLYQKGGLEQELPHKIDMSRFKKENMIQDEKSGLWKVKDEQGGEVIAETRQALIDDITSKPTKEELKRITEVAKLQQYNDPTAHFRMVREEVKRAATDGKTKLQFPTGETAMKIEGLGQAENTWISKSTKSFNAPLKQDILKTGMEVRNRNGNSDWIITDVLKDGKFKAVQKEKIGWDGKGDFKKWLKKETDAGYGLDDNMQEAFDISGKVDTKNPIYKFYEKDLGKYLTNKHKATRVTDDLGVEWYEVAITPEMASKPVEAFGRTLVSPLTIGGGLMGAGALAGVGYGAISKMGRTPQGTKAGSAGYQEKKGNQFKDILTPTPKGKSSMIDKAKNLVKSQLEKGEVDSAKFKDNIAMVFNKDLDPKEKKKIVNELSPYFTKAMLGSVSFGGKGKVAKEGFNIKFADKFKGMTKVDKASVIDQAMTLLGQGLSWSQVMGQLSKMYGKIL